MRSLFIILTLGASAACVQADSLILQNGQTVEGVFLGGDSRSVRFAAGDQVHTYSLSENQKSGIRRRIIAGWRFWVLGSADWTGRPGCYDSCRDPTGSASHRRGRFEERRRGTQLPSKPGETLDRQFTGIEVPTVPV